MNNNQVADVATAFSEALSRTRSQPQYLGGNVISLLSRRKSRKTLLLRGLTLLTVSGLATGIWVAARKQEH